MLYTGYRFGWGPQANGFVLAAVGISQAVVEGFLLHHVTDRMGARRTAITGYGAGALGYALLALALTGWTILPAVMAPLVTSGLFFAFTSSKVPLVLPGAPFALAAGAALFAGALLRKF